MNNARRKELDKALSIIEEATFEEQEAFDNLPEALQFGDKGDEMENNIQQLDEAKDLLENIIRPAN